MTVFFSNWTSPNGVQNIYSQYYDTPGSIFDNPFNTTLHPNRILPSNPSLANLCNAIFTSKAQQWLRTVPYVTTTETLYESLIPTATIAPRQAISAPAVEFTNVQAWVYPETYSTGVNKLPVPTLKPCCLNCTILGGNRVQIHYWPSPTQDPPISTLFDHSGFSL